MKQTPQSPSLEMLYLGAFAPNKDFSNTATSTAGDLFQLNFLTALAASSLTNPTVHAYFPVPTFPKSKKLFFGVKRVQLSNGLEVTSLPHFNLGAFKIVTLGISAAFRTLQWGLRNRKIDRKVVICYNLTAPPAWPISVVCKVLKLDLVPVICDICVPGEVVKDTFLRRMEFAGQKRLIPKVDGLLIINQAIIDDFAPNRHSLLIDGGVMEALVKRFEDNPRVADGTFHVVYAGQLSALNGVTLLLDTLKILDIPTLKVSILGGGEFATVVKDAAAQDSRITFHGLLPHDQVLSIYEQADLLVSLRRTDYQTHRYVFPSKVVECLATGRPLLTTCTGNVENEFSEMVFLLREETPEGLAAKLNELSMMTKEARESVGAKAKDHVRAHKTWEGHILRLDNYLANHVFSQRSDRASDNHRSRGGRDDA